VQSSESWMEERAMANDSYEHECPFCGATTDADKPYGKIKCSECGTEFIVERQTREETE
jgi:ribosomal protein L37AE/L43A